MGVIETIGIATGLFVLLLTALAPLLAELNDRLPVRPIAQRESGPTAAPAWVRGGVQPSA